MRLIDADSLQRRICGAKCGCEYEDCWNEEGCVYDHFISNSHTINAVPVVRCRECKKKNKKKCPMTIVNFGREGKEILVQNHVPDDFYCAAGERKEGADNG